MRGAYGLSQETKAVADAALKEIYDGIKDEYEKLGDLDLKRDTIFFRGYNSRGYHNSNLVEIGQVDRTTGQIQAQPTGAV